MEVEYGEVRVAATRTVEISNLAPLEELLDSVSLLFEAENNDRRPRVGRLAVGLAQHGQPHRHGFERVTGGLEFIIRPRRNGPSMSSQRWRIWGVGFWSIRHMSFR
jgi:hypothetical protein